MFAKFRNKRAGYLAANRVHRVRPGQTRSLRNRPEPGSCPKPRPGPDPDPVKKAGSWPGPTRTRLPMCHSAKYTLYLPTQVKYTSKHMPIGLNQGLQFNSVVFMENLSFYCSILSSFVMLLIWFTEITEFTENCSALHKCAKTGETVYSIDVMSTIFS